MTGEQYVIACLCGLVALLGLLLAIAVGAYSDLAQKLRVRGRGHPGELIRLTLGQREVDFKILEIQHQTAPFAEVRIELLDAQAYGRLVTRSRIQKAYDDTVVAFAQGGRGGAGGSASGPGGIAGQGGAGGNVSGPGTPGAGGGR